MAVRGTLVILATQLAMVLQVCEVQGKVLEAFFRN